MKSVVSCFLIICMAGLAYTAEVTSFAEAKKMSDLTGKPILIDFWADN